MSCIAYRKMKKDLNLTSLTDLPLHKQLFKALDLLGFSEATEVQKLNNERGWAETDEERRVRLEGEVNPVVQYAREKQMENLDEIKALNVRMNTARVAGVREVQVRHPNNY